MARSIVITGCSTGLGRATALRLARNGWQVFATVRREADAASLAVEAEGTGSDGRLVLTLCDITVAEDVARLGSLVRERVQKLEALLNNAGTGYGGPMETIPLEDVRAQLEINTIGHLAVTQALLPLLKAARGTIINVSSVGGRMVFPVNGAYNMSKYALEAMSDALRVELAPLGVKVVIMEPAGSPTAIWSTTTNRGLTRSLAGPNQEYAPLIDAVRRYARLSETTGFPPELFARAVERVLSQRRPPSRYPVPFTARILIGLHQLLPDSVWDWATRRVLRW